MGGAYRMGGHVRVRARPTGWGLALTRSRTARGMQWLRVQRWPWGYTAAFLGWLNWGLTLQVSLPDEHKKIQDTQEKILV